MGCRLHFFIAVSHLDRRVIDYQKFRRRKFRRQKFHRQNFRRR